MSATAPAIQFDIAQLKLDVVKRTIKNLDARIGAAIVDGSIERTMDGASTLTLNVHDPARALLKSGIFEHRIDVTLDGYSFRLVQTAKSDSELTLTFEDREVSLLRQRTGSAKASRATMTRAEFAASLVAEVKPPIRFVCPELHERQPIATTKGGKADVREVRKALPFQFRRGSQDGKLEDSWQCLTRLAGEVDWHCWASKGAVYFVSDPALLDVAPTMILDETSPGVSAIDFDIDSGKVNSEVTITARAARWAADPGSVVRLHDLGPADGPWLVHSMRRGVYDADATIILRAKSKPLPEPAAETAAGVSGSSGSVTADSAYGAALAIDAKRYPYVWGGGHGAAGTPSGGVSGGEGGGIGLTGFDCSGSVCAVLAAAGLGFQLGGPVETSGRLASWGASGRGQHLTVYANAIHTFIVFHGAKGDQHWGTGNWGKSWGGAGFNPNLHPTAGFTARHWPGT